MRRFILLLLSLVIGPLGGAIHRAEATTRRVPSEFSTIQAALDLSVAGDTVLVASGTYTDTTIRNVGGFNERSCAFMADGVVLRSEGGADVTTLDMQGLGGAQAAVVWCSGLPSEDTWIEGFTLTGAPINYRGGWVVFSGKVTFRECVFRDLDAGNSSGAGLAANGDLDVVGCEFVNCVGNNAGGLYHSGGHLNLFRTTFRECDGRGAYLSGNAGGPGESALVEDCLFLDNRTRGLQISRYDLGAVVRRCVFEGNTIELYSGAGLAVSEYGDKLIEDCLFLNNAVVSGSGQGGALVVGGNGSCVIRGNTFHGNSQVFEANGFGGSAMSVHTTARAERNVISGSGGNTAVYVESPGQLTTDCNVFWDNEDGPGIPLGPTDREIDPQFCDPASGDFAVHSTSPCVEPGSLGCGQIGAFGAACGTISIEPQSWGRIKELYRKGGTP